MNFGEILLSGLAGPLQSIGQAQLSELFRKIKPAETQKTVLLGLYPAVDMELEKLAKASKSKIDDALVGAVKNSIEEVAGEIGLTLPNNDGD